MKSISGIIKFDNTSDFNFATRNDKFADEKVNYEDDNYVIHFDGIILNNKKLEKQLSCKGNREIITQLYEQYGANLVFHMKGAYVLAIMDKRNNKLLLTNDLLSKRSIYYHIASDKLIYCGSFFDLIDAFANEGIEPDINQDAVTSMMCRYFLEGNQTYHSNVYYLNAFESIAVDLNSHDVRVIKHDIKDMNVPDDEELIIEKFNELFTNAVKLQFEKNNQYGYHQVATLSGGMDSRSCLLKGVELGYGNDLLCFNYAQSGSLDFKISQEIANDHKLNYIFYPMDNALFMNKRSNAMSKNECQQPSVGSTAAISMAEILNTTEFGILNIGICGGELLGDIIKVKTDDQQGTSLLHKALRFFKGSVSSPDNLIYDMNELFNHLRASQNFAYMFSDKCEAISPYMDEDVFMFVSQIKPHLLFRRNIYIRWMKKYLPNPYIVTHTCCPLNASTLKVLFKKTYYHLQKKFKGNSTREMNPFDFWFKNNPQYVESFNSEFQQLCQDISNKYNNEDAVKAAKNEWGSNWRKNLCILTALNAVDKIYKTLS